MSLHGNGSGLPEKPTPLVRAYTPEPVSDPDEYPPDGCGRGGRGYVVMLRVVTSKGRVWRIPYNCFHPVEGEKEGEPRAEFGFTFERGEFLLILHGNPAYLEDPQRNLDSIVRQIEEGGRRIIRPGDRVPKIEVVEG